MKSQLVQLGTWLAQLRISANVKLRNFKLPENSSCSNLETTQIQLARLHPQLQRLQVSKIWKYKILSVSNTQTSRTDALKHDLVDLDSKFSVQNTKLRCYARYSQVTQLQEFYVKLRNLASFTSCKSASSSNFESLLTHQSVVSWDLIDTRKHLTNACGCCKGDALFVSRNSQM